MSTRKSSIRKRSQERSRSPRRGSNAVAELISTLFHSRNQAHILHLQTNSFAAHKALNGYYDGIVPLADKYAEAYQGIYGIIKGYKTPVKYVEGDKAILPYFKKLEKQIKSMKTKLPKNEDLENTYADILDLIHSTQYLLTELK
jgi:hypothetical protein